MNEPGGGAHPTLPLTDYGPDGKERSRATLVRRADVFQVSLGVVKTSEPQPGSSEGLS